MYALEGRGVVAADSFGLGGEVHVAPAPAVEGAVAVVPAADGTFVMLGLVACGAADSAAPVVAIAPAVPTAFGAPVAPDRMLAVSELAGGGANVAAELFAIAGTVDVAPDGS